jgi:hypothetical protein
MTRRPLKTQVSERKRAIDEMLRRDIAGETYTPPAWLEKPVPEPDTSSANKSDRRGQTSDLFRRTGDRE